MEDFERGTRLFEEITRPLIDSGILTEFSRSRDGTFSVSTELDSVALGSIWSSVASTSPTKTGALIVELREARVAELVAAGVGTRPSKEYSGLRLGHLEAMSFDVEIWKSLLDEAIKFARTDFTILECWQLQTEGSRHFDTTLDHFIGDLLPDEYESAFGDLPDGASFVKRLKRLYDVPRGGIAATHDEILELAKAVIATKIQVVEHSGEDSPEWAELRAWLEDLTYSTAMAFPNPTANGDHSSRLGDLLLHKSRFDEEIVAHGPPGEWTHVLREACYNLTTFPDVRDWLLQDWLTSDVDLEPLFELYRVGGWYQIDDSGVMTVVQR